MFRIASAASTKAITFTIYVFTFKTRILQAVTLVLSSISSLAYA